MIEAVSCQIIHSNQSLSLTSSEQLYRVEKGSLALFCVEKVEESWEGHRHYWFTVTEGEILWGIDPGNVPFGLMAIALEQTEVTPLAESDLASPETWSPEILGWLTHLGRFLADKLPSPPHPPLNPNQISQPLAPQAIIQGSNNLLWLQCHQGKLHFLGQPDLLLCADSVPIPLFLQQWFRADETTQIELTTEPPQPENLHRGMAQYHQLLIGYLDKFYQYEARLEVHKLEQRVQQNQAVIENTLAKLSTVFGRPPAQNIEQLPTPLLRAMGRIGRYLNVEIKPPPASEDLKRLKNPLEGIIRASRLQMRYVLLSGQWWNQDNGPLLAYRQNKAPVALIPVPGHPYLIYDPVAQTTATLSVEVANSLAPMALMFYRTFTAQVIGIGAILKFALYQRYGDLFLIAICALSATLLNMLNPILIGHLFNEVIPNAETGLLWQMGLVLVTSAISVTFFKLTQGFTLLRLETASDASTQAAVWDRVLQLQARFFRQYSSGDLQSRIMGITKIRRQLSGSTLNVILSSFFALLNLGLMLYYSFDIALLGLATAIATVMITTIHSYIIVRQNRLLLNLEGEIFGKVVQIINSVAKLRVAGAQERAFAYWANDYRQRSELNLKINITTNSLNLSNQVLSSVVTIVLFWFTYGQMRPLNPFVLPELSVGNFMAANAALGTFVGSITSLSNTLVGSLDVLNLWERTQPVLKAPLEVDKTKIDPGKLNGKITVSDLVFRYQPEQSPILNGVSLTVNAGDFVALVGTTGCGKSTLLRLLLGFETPEAGAIYYDDQDLAQLNIQAVRRQLGVVLQTSRLQAASIFDNIAGGSLVTLDEAWQAAAMAGFAADIKAMPMGMNTVVSEGGTNLSGGQRQRLLIAKALVLKPKILLFDEATSALDNQTQAIVTESLDQLNVSRLVIAHRLSTIRYADRIYVLDQGRIVQQGNFEELAHQPGLFAQLTARQML
ncbi:MAG: NHLP bacteriocin export ABC transporter permease/ATPase subunit [Microcystis aeruginosa LG13-03]|nr:NHLP bacteriocin export ABC transporter permease/ATPase subunit [Microcystis aeruginosa LG13-13]NCR02479.1 NHLP bacteriocin export ABC transporter permease/ATPase subunit [Microcystis aeruginosa LG13-03]NCR60678.1 NHLP bacteriocin export ABC transporter permease/ATPase subunit [Microcystis aeruginosa LG11-05]